ncbi:unnamed protein product, partial [Hymenolepis diminuta]
MEMLDMATGGQWTSLTFFSHPLNIRSMAIVGKELFFLVFGRPALYSVELEGDLKLPLAKWRRWK